MAVSTNQTSSLENQHKILNEQGIIVTEPSWLWYEVWWFRGMAFLNWYGITDPAHQGVFVGYLGDVLHRLCSSQGMSQWRSQYCHIQHGQYRQGLRNLLPRLGIHNWCEITSGLSWRAYCGLDVYLRVFSNNMPPPTVEAQYLLNADCPVLDRRVPRAEDWWRFSVWRSIGQAEVVS